MRQASTVVKIPTTVLLCITAAEPYLCSAMVVTTTSSGCATLPGGARLVDVHLAALR